MYCPINRVEDGIHPEFIKQDRWCTCVSFWKTPGMGLGARVNPAQFQIIHSVIYPIHLCNNLHSHSENVYKT